MIQYASEDMLRVYLPGEGTTPEVNKALADVLTRATTVLSRQLRFSFGGAAVSRWCDVGYLTRLQLPPPGMDTAKTITVVEGGVTLTTNQYDPDPDLGLFITRLEDGAVTQWLSGRRSVLVTYTPAPPPEDLQQACLELAVDIWRSKGAGKDGVVGVAGDNELTFPRAFSPETRKTLKAIRKQYGVDR